VSSEGSISGSFLLVPEVPNVRELSLPPGRTGISPSLKEDGDGHLDKMDDFII